MDIATCAAQSTWLSALGDALGGAAALIAAITAVIALVKGSSELKAWRTQKRADRQAEAALHFVTKASRLLDRIERGGALLDVRVEGKDEAWEPPFLAELASHNDAIRAAAADLEGACKEVAIYPPPDVFRVASEILRQAERVIALDTPMLTLALQREHPNHTGRIKWVSPAYVADDLRQRMNKVLGPYARWER